MTALFGVIRNHTPHVLANILKGGILRLETTPAPEEVARILITVDTGFTGGFSLPEEQMAHLKLDFLGYVSYVLADGRKADTPTFMGEAMVESKVIQTRFIPGQPLMGIEFMEAAFSSLAIDFRSGQLTLQ